MDYRFDICFNQEFPTIKVFEAWVNDLLLQHELHEKYTADWIADLISDDCQVFQAVSEYPEVQIALLKTVCLEIVETLKHRFDSTKENRQRFDTAIQALFDGSNEDARIFCASITRLLRQFRLSKTYDAREIIAEAYTRGVKSIESGKRIDNPLGWLRGACLNVIREFQRDQKDAHNPKFDKQPWSPGGLVFSELMLKEDVLAIQAAVKALSPEEQEILQKRIMEGMPWKAVGKSMNPPLKEGTARQRGARTLDKLEQIYNDIREDIRIPEDAPDLKQE